MLIQFIAFVPVLIFSPLFAIAASLDPMKIWIINLGETIAVASAYIKGWTVGKVDIAPFEIEYGRGHKRIMHKSFRPSCFNTKDKALNLVSFATSRCTKFDRTVLDTTKEHVDPTIVAVAAMNHPSGNPYTKPAMVRHVE